MLEWLSESNETCDENTLIRLLPRRQIIIDPSGMITGTHIPLREAQEYVLDSRAYHGLSQEVQEVYSKSLRTVEEYGAVPMLKYLEDSEFFSKRFTNSRLVVMNCDLPIKLALKYVITTAMQQKEEISGYTFEEKMAVKDIIESEFLDMSTFLDLRDQIEIDEL